MLPCGPDEYLERLLAAHGAEDAFEPAGPADEGAMDIPARPARPAASGEVDPTPILQLLGEAERLCGIGIARLHAAAAA